MRTLIDRGMNDQWPRPMAWREVDATNGGGYELRLDEPLRQAWAAEVVGYDVPEAVRGRRLAVTLAGRTVASQQAGGRLYLLVEALQPGESRVYRVQAAGAWTSDISGAVTHDDSAVFRATAEGLVFANDHLALLLPRSQEGTAGNDATSTTAGTAAIPAAILAVRRGDGPWRGRGRVETPHTLERLTTRLVAAGALFTTVAVTHQFVGGHTWETRLRLGVHDDYVRVEERCDLPSKLWPQPRPYWEIGSLGASFWAQPLDKIARPCVRPSPTSNFIFDVGFADRMVTHSTAAWEVMDMPLRIGELKAYTAMRASYPGIDAGWLGVYAQAEGDAIGVASVDLAHWESPDHTVHPKHRTPSANAEVALMDDSSGTHFTFPLERVRREWLLVVCERWEAEAKPVMQPVKFANDPTMPFWSHRLRHGDLPLDKVKDWTTRWHDSGAAHPRVFCDPADLPAIRERVAATPALRDNYAQSRQIHVADRYLMEGDAGIATVLADGGALAAIEATTIGKELLLGILERGYIGPSYAIALTRPMRRYAMACDMMWHSFNDAEKADARWVCAVSAYIMSDGDWWQFAWRAGETTYLPNFNSDVYCAAGLIGLFLADHPCTAAWTGYFARRVELELERHIRVDGGGEENLGSYYHSTWMQLLMPSLWALRHAGVRDYSGDSRVAGAAQFVLKILTPPDPREANKRFFPPIGHHPHARKAFSYLAQLASFIHRAKPRLAEHLMWAWEASGSPVGNLHDHKGPTANPFTRHYVFHDPTIPPVAPVLLSANLPHVGAVMRSHDASGQGSYLLIKAGRIHSHHDPDEGSFHYFGRGVPLALDGLRLANGSNAREHNGLSFPADGQPTARIEQFVSTPGADYLRARALPRGFSIDPMYLDNLHRSGFVRELLMVKADAPGGVEYVVVKDVALGPDAPTWNLDVLSRQPEVHGNRVWFPGHPEFAMGMDVIVVEPFGECDSETGEPAATSSLSGMEIAPGVVNPDLLDPEKRAKLPAIHVRYTIHEHWHLHLPAGPGETFLVVLFPRRPGESVPIIEYLAREEVLVITHDEGRDLVFLRSNTAIPLNLDGVTFQGHSGVVRDRHTAPAGGAVRTLVPLDAFDMARTADRPGPDTLR